MRGFKTEIKLNNKEMTMAKQHCGVGRHAWNWGLALCKEVSDSGGAIPSAVDLHKILVSDVKPNNLWYYESSKCAPQQKLRDLEKSYKRYYKELKDGTIQKKKDKYIASRKRKGLPINYDKLNDIGKPNFKKKKSDSDCFYLEGNIQIQGKKIKVPIFEWIRTYEKLPECKPKNVVISRKADRWYISFKREVEIAHTVKKHEMTGADWGIKTLVTYSDGTKKANPKAYSKNKRRLKLAQRKLSKKHKKDAKTQSKNYYKAAAEVAKIHARVARIRNDNIHKITSDLCKNHAVICLEDLDITNMSKNHKLASALLDGGYGEMTRQVGYKTKWYGSQVVYVDRFFPSSKMCSCCGNVKKELKLKERTYHCDVCGHEQDRDLNAAINIKKRGGELLRLQPVEDKQSQTVFGCPTKQEGNSKGNFV